jgi:hypothetical protein
MSYTVTFNKSGMMPVVWRAADWTEAVAIAEMPGSQSRINRGYAVTISNQTERESA